MSPPRIALVTSVAGRPHDDDLPPLIDAIAGRGADVDVVDWDDPAIDWSGFDLAVIRSTWDYTTRLAEFLEWTERCGASTCLVNQPAVIAWNTDKRYLDQLDGVRVVATSFIEPGGRVALPEVGEFVVKPTVSAGSRDTVRYRAGDHDAANAQIAELLAVDRVVMVQPYQLAVDAEGETALLFFGGEFSHAINKGPLLTAGEAATRALFAQEHIAVTDATPEQLRVARECLDAIERVPALAGVTFPLTYARIDVLRDNDGEVSVLEVELTEPSLFLDWSNGGADRYAEVLVAMASRIRDSSSG